MEQDKAGPGILKFLQVLSDKITKQEPVGQSQATTSLLSFFLTMSEKMESSRNEKIQPLGEGFKQNRLVLVLGAGVSMEQGLPSWNILLQKLLIDTFNVEEEGSLLLANLFVKLFDPSLLISARYLRQNLPESKNKLGFEKAVREAIYDRLDVQNISDTMREIRQFCSAPGRCSNIDSVITYNYDDLLEQTLRGSDIEIRFKAIHGVGMQASPFELPIYHVRGFLPHEGRLEEGHRITLSEDIYHEQYNDIYSWNNIVQINKFRDNTCLFIGTSFTDPNLRRLLDIARLQKGTKSKHYLVKKKYDRSTLAKNLRPMLKSEFSGATGTRKNKLTPEQAAKLLADSMEAFEERDARSFDVETVWIEDYGEIPKILKEIRNS